MHFFLYEIISERRPIHLPQTICRTRYQGHGHQKMDHNKNLIKFVHIFLS